MNSKWVNATIKDIAEIKKGSYITKKDAKQGPYPVILGGREPAYYINQYNHEGKAIVISRSGASAGYVSFWNENIFVTDGFVIEPKENISYEYLYYLLKSKQEELHYLQRGAAIPHVTPTLLYELKIQLPPFQIRERIGTILEVYDKLIENSLKQIKLLEETAQRLYKEWFVDLHFPGYEDAAIIDGMPEGWNKCLIGDVIGKVTRTKQIKTADYLIEGSIPVIDQSHDFIAGYTNDAEAIVNMDCPVIVFGDHTRILKYIQFPFAKGADGTQLIVSINKKMPQSLLYYSLIAVDLSNYHYARHFKYLKAESILVPTKEIADKFERIVSSILLQIQKLRDMSNKSSQARNRLLPKLMSGELEV